MFFSERDWLREIGIVSKVGETRRGHVRDRLQRPIEIDGHFSGVERDTIGTGRGRSLYGYSRSQSIARFTSRQRRHAARYHSHGSDAYASLRVLGKYLIST